jgi:hypothetical protein
MRSKSSADQRSGAVRRRSARRLGWGAAPLLVALSPVAAFAQAPAAGAAKAPAAEALKLTSAPAGAQARRWTAATPDEMLSAALARVRRGGDDAIAGLVVAAALDDRASFNRARQGLEQLAASPSPLADDARWLAASLAPSEATADWSGTQALSYDAPPDPNGLVKAFAILGPFQDNSGGGLTRREGPEAPGERFSDTNARYAWGVYDVAWRRVLPAASTARGVPLDLYIHPRSESCTYLASRVTLPAALDRKPILLHVGATGALRLIWDGADIAASDAIHSHLVLDRIAVRIEAPAGDHLLAVKVCSGAIADEGRVRVRFTDEQRHPAAIATSSDLTPLKSPAATLPSKVTLVKTALEKALEDLGSSSEEQQDTTPISGWLGGAD